MSLDDMIETYGYAAILLGTFLEGETVLVLGGVAAKLEYLRLPWVILCAFIGTFLGDQLYFLLGRYKGEEIIARWPWWHRRVERGLRMLEKRRMLVILGFRFIYGIRTVTPFVLGMSRVPTLDFMLLNAMSAVVWASLFGSLGYVFGKSLELLLGDIRRYEAAILITILGLGITLLLIRVIRRKLREK